MKVNDLIELLEYSPARAPVSLVVVGPDQRAVRYDDPLFLTKDGRVYLVVAPRPENPSSVGLATDDVDLSQLECPQVFGHHFMLLTKPSS